MSLSQNKFKTELLASYHNKKEFCCGEAMLDNYLHKQAGQDVKRKLSVCFVLNDEQINLVKGYYTLSNNGIPLNLVPDLVRKKIPSSYATLPTTLLGRLAIDKRYQSGGLGKLLLVDALKRSWQLSLEIGSFAVIVDPLHDKAKDFYLKYGFIELPDSKKMFLPMNTIKQLFS
ncbi:GNAT family N-acetyltransferase [Apibacter raozihei]|uniref:GNAT family N-acetyltransferase n=1 Tax=Apibacter raozihei TaxID=2500547 RepID=UPI000FE4376C|nr:GNAT family N-acetyltransferase [Apibacter raozihei]